MEQPRSYLRTMKNLLTIKGKILQFIIPPSPNSFYNCHNPRGIKFIAKLRLGLGSLREHKLKHSFKVSINPLCNCGSGVESTTYFLFPSTISNTDTKLLNNSDSFRTQNKLTFQ